MSSKLRKARLFSVSCELGWGTMKQNSLRRLCLLDVELEMIMQKIDYVENDPKNYFCMYEKWPYPVLQFLLSPSNVFSDSIKLTSPS